MNKISDIFYEKHFLVRFDLEEFSGFYFLDYDERAAVINMEFQHLHPFYEIMLLLSPKASHYINGIPYEIRQGDMVLLRPGLLHKSQYLPGEPSQRLIINFALPNITSGTTEAIDHLLSIFNELFPIFRFADPYRKLLITAINDMFAYSHSEEFDLSSFSKFVFQQKFLHFLYTLYSIASHNQYHPESTSDALTQKIYDINNYILSHYSESLTLEGIAKEFYISPCYLSHQFKTINQFTLSSYIQMTRVRNAQYFLLSTDMRITEIAQQCGFQSFSQFNRTFHKYSGCSPSEFQKKNPMPNLKMGGKK